LDKQPLQAGSIQNNLVAAHKFHVAATRKKAEQNSDGAVARTAVASGAGAGQGLIHDAADRAGAAAALGTAAEAAVDLAGGPWGARRRDGGTDILVGEDVTGTDDHGNAGAWVSGTRYTHPVTQALTKIKRKMLL
jgi:hypothetical protein